MCPKMCHSTRCDANKGQIRLQHTSILAHRNLLSGVFVQTKCMDERKNRVRETIATPIVFVMRRLKPSNSFLLFLAFRWLVPYSGATHCLVHPFFNGTFSVYINNTLVARQRILLPFTLKDLTCSRFSRQTVCVCASPWFGIKMLYCH